VDRHFSGLRLRQTVLALRHFSSRLDDLDRGRQPALAASLRRLRDSAGSLKRLTRHHRLRAGGAQTEIGPGDLEDDLLVTGLEGNVGSDGGMFGGVDSGASAEIEELPANREKR